MIEWRGWCEVRVALVAKWAKEWRGVCEVGERRRSGRGEWCEVVRGVSDGEGGARLGVARCNGMGMERCEMKRPYIYQRKSPNMPSALGVIVSFS